MFKIFTRRGKKITLLNPAEKAQKYADELRNNVALTNESNIKFDENGKPKKLTLAQRMFKIGYLQAREDSAKAYNYNQRKKLK